MYLFQRIEEVTIQHNDTRRVIGEFILQEKAKVLNYTIKEIAELTYTSKAAVVRFAQSLGYSGWREFIKAFMQEVHYQERHSQDIDANYPFEMNDSTKDIVEKLKTLQMETLQDTVDIMDIQMVDKATDMLLKAKRIAIFGLSPNNFLGELFRRKLTAIGKPIEVVNSGEGGIVSRTLTEEDCVIMISYSGNNIKVVPILHLTMLQERHVPVIGITSGGSTYIRDHVACVLTISSREKLFTKIANFTTEQSISFILNILFSTYFTKNYQANAKFKIEGARLLEVQRETTLKEMRDEF